VPHDPGGSKRVHLSVASPFRAAFPVSQGGGIRDITFEAHSGFTCITARRIAQPPRAAFVTRLRPDQSPGRAARQRPEQTDNSLGGIFLHW
jgi:hypothetical protein